MDSTFDLMQGDNGKAKGIQDMELHTLSGVPSMTKEDIIRMAREAGLAYGSDEKPLKSVTLFAALVAEYEREACAKVCEQITNELSRWPPSYEGVNTETKFIRTMGTVIGQPFIEAIRARGQA